MIGQKFHHDAGAPAFAKPVEGYSLDGLPETDSSQPKTGSSKNADTRTLHSMRNSWCQMDFYKRP